jgi:hypothetical protein
MTAPLHEPIRGDGREQQAVEVGHETCRPSRLLRRLDQRAPEVSPAVLVGNVVRPVEPGVRRHGDDEEAGGADDTPKLAQARHIVVQMLDHVERRSEIEGRVLERKGLHHALDDLPGPTGARDGRRLRRGLQTGDGTQGGQHGKGAAPTASCVEPTGRTRQVEGSQCSSHDTAPAPVPPV